MPAAKRISKEAIIDAAAAVLRTGGFEAINARSVAKALGCSALTLDSGVQRQRAHHFYFREGMHIASFSFKKALK